MSARRYPGPATGMVKAAYSSGKPAFAEGGNVRAGTLADLEDRSQKSSGKSFDYGRVLRERPSGERSLPTAF